MKMKASREKSEDGDGTDGATMLFALTPLSVNTGATREVWWRTAD